MKVYVEILKGQDNSGFQQLIILPAPNGFELCENSDDADIIVIGNRAHMEELLNLDQSFLIISTEEVKDIPENVFWVSAYDYENSMVNFFEEMAE